MSAADVKMEIPVLVQSLKSSILSSTSFQMDKTVCGVVSAAVEQHGCSGRREIWPLRLAQDPSKPKKKSVQLFTSDLCLRVEGVVMPFNAFLAIWAASCFWVTITLNKILFFISVRLAVPHGQPICWSWQLKSRKTNMLVQTCNFNLPGYLGRTPKLRLLMHELLLLSCSKQICHIMSVLEIPTHKIKTKSF